MFSRAGFEVPSEFNFSYKERVYNSKRLKIFMRCQGDRHPTLFVFTAKFGIRLSISGNLLNCFYGDVFVDHRFQRMVLNLLERNRDLLVRNFDLATRGEPLLALR